MKAARLQAAAAVFARYFKWIALIATAAGIAVALVGQRDAIRDFDWSLDWGAFTVAVLLFAVGPWVQGAAFWLVLRAMRVPAPFPEAMLVWTRSFLVRYAPSGALALVLRVRERERLSASAADVYASFGYEQVVALASGAVACLVGFALAGSWPPLVATVVSLACVGVAVLARPAFLGRLLQRKLSDRGHVVHSLVRGRILALVIAFNALSWVATGAATWTLIESLSEEGAPSLAWLVGVYAFSYLLGFLVPLLPGGLGLRDATLIGFLATRFGAGVATALGLTLRLANTLGEFVAIVVVEALYRARGRGRILLDRLHEPTRSPPRERL